MRRNFLDDYDIALLWAVDESGPGARVVPHISQNAKRYSELAEAGYLTLIPSDLGDFHCYKMAQNGQQALKRRTRGKGNGD
jgi:hypothetical protein